MFSEICHNVIIVEQRIVAVEQGDNVTWSSHMTLSLC
jgi:hypothetical protein